MTLDLPARASHSQYESLAKCEVAYVLSKAHRPPRTPAWYFLGGFALHAATEAWDLQRAELGNEVVGTDFLVSEFNRVFTVEIEEALVDEPDQSRWAAGGARGTKDDPDKNKEREAFYRENGPKWLGLYAEQCGNQNYLETDAGPGIEFQFNVELGGGLWTGSIDRIVIAHDGQLGIRDLKFGKSDGNPFQLAIYRMAVWNATGDLPTWGDFWNPRKGGIQAPMSLEWFTYDRMNRLAEAFVQRRQELVAGRRPMPANNSMTCKNCDMRDYCEWQSTTPEKVIKLG